MESDTLVVVIFNVLLDKSYSIDIVVKTLSNIFSRINDNFELIDLLIKDRFDFMLVVSTGGELSLNKS